MESARLEEQQTIQVRAAFSSYLALSGIWVVLAVANGVFAIQTPGRGWEKAAAIAGGAALLWWCWLLGFKITLTKSFLEYRNGFFRSSKIALSEIVQLKDASIEWNVIGRRIRVPHLLIISRDERVVMSINPKPFKRVDLQRVRLAIEKSHV